MRGVPALSHVLLNIGDAGIDVDGGRLAPFEEQLLALFLGVPRQADGHQIVIGLKRDIGGRFGLAVLPKILGESELLQCLLMGFSLGHHRDRRNGLGRNGEPPIGDDVFGFPFLVRRRLLPLVPRFRSGYLRLGPCKPGNTDEKDDEGQSIQGSGSII